MSAVTVSAETRHEHRRRKHHGRMVFETTYVNFDPIPTWIRLFQVFGFGNFPSTSGVWKNPATAPPQPDLELVEHDELMSERQIIQREMGMGLEAGEEGSQKRQNDIKHDEACFGRRSSKINLFEG